jgi:hypothetical protein
MTLPSGVVIDSGDSFLGGPYVAIMTFRSKNTKTGDIPQVFIIRPDIEPTDAVQSGADVSICGGCTHKLRWHEDLQEFKRTCYVNVGQSVGSVFACFKRRGYPDLWDDLALVAEVSEWLADKFVRWGSYGDPSVIKHSVVRMINNWAAGHLGFTHQWLHPAAANFKGIFQASCESDTQYRVAKQLGWKTYTVIPTTGPDGKPLEVLEGPGKRCPATLEGSTAQCKTCRLCNGAKADIYSPAHGTAHRSFAPIHDLPTRAPFVSN